jgi:hypothetical protein
VDLEPFLLPTHRTEQGLLLYLESRAVDYDGRLDDRHLNREDRAILKRWTAAGYVRSGRVAFRNPTTGEPVVGRLMNGMTWATLSEDAWRHAHQLRRERARKADERRKAEGEWETTDEKRARRSNEAATPEDL